MGPPESTKVELVEAASASDKDAADSSTDASFGVPVSDTGVRNSACVIANDDATEHANRAIVE